MKKHQLLDASTRVALAAYLHDLGKFAERAGIAEAEVKDSAGNSLKDVNKQQYCPNFNGSYSHVHAAYTAIAMDVIEQHLPDIKKQDCFPFASWAAGNMGEATDSLINAAARHHKPETFMQWVIACADRLSSGFERSTFEEYNRAEEETKDKRSHITARMEVLLEKVCVDKSPLEPAHRYVLKPLSPLALMPVAKDKAEHRGNAAGRAEYAALWEEFMQALQSDSGEDSIPPSHKRDLALWMDHFDSLWLTFTHCIPSATAAKVGGKFIAIPTDVSLYDHAKSTAALATALWRWHQAHNKCDSADAKSIKDGEDYSVEKFLLIQGDMFGIQDFIFQTGGSSTKYASKLLRGRSFYVSLMAECAALRVLDALGLPPVSQITNAAGKFLIVAPNTADVIAALSAIRVDFDAWSLKNTQGRVGLGLAWTKATPNDFISSNNQSHAFQILINKLFAELDIQKHQRLQLWHADKPTVLTEYSKSFDSEKGVCQIDGVSPAVWVKDEIALGQMAKDQISIGNHLAKSHRLLVTRQKLNMSSIDGDILGFYIHFTEGEDVSGFFAKEVENNNLLRCWDFSLPDDDGYKPLWNGYARRYINGYVARFSQDDLYAQGGKYEQFESELDCILSGGEIKTFNHIACEDRRPVDANCKVINDPTAANAWIGTPGLHALKGDVDDLGVIFQSGSKNPNFAKMAALSRQLNAFFAIYLPWLCKTKYPHTYTIFAGGDDFFLVGPWKSQMQLADNMVAEFKRYVANNEEIHFSAGLHLSKPGLPIHTLSIGADMALERAKAREGKNAVTCFDHTMDWDKFSELLNEADWLRITQEKLGLSTGLLYGLLNLAEMADLRNANDPKKAIWRSQLSYRIARWVSDKHKINEGEEPKAYQDRIRQISNDLICKLADKLKNNGLYYHVPLYTHLYTFRD